MFLGYKAWREQQYLLNRMGIPELNRAYFSYPGVQTYIAVLLVALVGMLVVGGDPLLIGLALLVAVAGHLIVWYVTHRWILHSTLLMRFKFTAKLWKRTHYDHHQRPNELAVLFGGLHTTLPPIALIYGPLGYLIAGPAGVFAGIVSGVAMTMFYEYIHCIQHLGFMPKNKMLQHVKRAHLLHHYHDEKGNYSITAFWFDRLLGSYYPDATARGRSATVRNLGYDDDMAQIYPWVKEATEEMQQQEEIKAATAAE